MKPCQKSPELSAIFEKISMTADNAGWVFKDVHDRNLLGETALHCAAVWGDVKIGKILLDAGADPNVHGE